MKAAQLTIRIQAKYHTGLRHALFNSGGIGHSHLATVENGIGHAHWIVMQYNGNGIAFV